MWMRLDVTDDDSYSLYQCWMTTIKSKGNLERSVFHSELYGIRSTRCELIECKFTELTLLGYFIYKLYQDSESI